MSTNNKSLNCLLQVSSVSPILNSLFENKPILKKKCWILVTPHSALYQPHQVSFDNHPQLCCSRQQDLPSGNPDDNTVPLTFIPPHTTTTDHWTWP